MVTNIIFTSVFSSHSWHIPLPLHLPPCVLFCTLWGSYPTHLSLVSLLSLVSRMAPFVPPIYDSWPYTLFLFHPFFTCLLCPFCQTLSLTSFPPPYSITSLNSPYYASLQLFSHLSVTVTRLLTWISDIYHFVTVRVASSSSPPW